MFRIGLNSLSELLGGVTQCRQKDFVHKLDGVTRISLDQVSRMTFLEKDPRPKTVLILLIFVVNKGVAPRDKLSD